MKRIIPFLTVATVAIAVGMSSSAVTWATSESLTKTGQTPETGWTADASIAKNTTGNAALTVSQAPIAGDITYNIDQEGGAGYEFTISVSGATCSITGTETDPTACKTSTGDAGSTGRLCGDGTGPVVYQVTATSDYSPSDDTELLCDVSVSNLGANIGYVPHIKKLKLEHVAYLNWNTASPSSQGASGLLETYSSPDGKRHYIAVGEVSAHNLPFFGPGPQNTHIFMWDDTSKKFELNSTLPAVTGEIITAVGFFTQLANTNQDYVQRSATYDSHRAGVGTSLIKTYAFDYNSTKKFISHKPSDDNYIGGLKNVSDLSYFENGGKHYLLVTESGSQYAGYNQKATMYEYDGVCPCFKPSLAKGSTNTYAAQSVHSYMEGSTRYFLFANAHDHIRYNLTNKVKKYDFTTHQFSDVGSGVSTNQNTAFIDFPVTIGGTTQNYLIVTNDWYDMKKANPTYADLNPGTNVYESSAGVTGDIAQQLKDISLPLYVRSWEHITLDGEHYFFTGFSKNPGGTDDKKRQIYGWCSEEAVATKGHWCDNKTANFIYPYADLTIPGDSANPHPLTYDWKSFKIGEDTYVVRIDNTKTGANSAQLLKAVKE